jgi:hypothetical protein
MAFPGSPQRNVAEARVAKDQLNLRLGTGSTTYVAVPSQDSNGNPILTIQTSNFTSWSTGAQYAVIQFAMNGNLNNVDVLGLSQTVYTPEIINICVEGNTAGSGSPQPASNDLTSVIGWQLWLTILGTIFSFGPKVQVFNSGHGVQPSVSGITGTPIAVFDDLFNPLTSTM